MQKRLNKSNRGHNSPFNSFSAQQKIHPAIQYFRQLQGQSSPRQLEAFLSSFAEPKLMNYENFVIGVKRFIELANSNSLGKGINRNALYGTIYLGLHSNNELVTLWNGEYLDQEPLKASEVTTLSPSGWDFILQDGFTTLIYKGQQPAQALDDLVKGPTVIDCGMFTQLGLWFGIRYMLGNERFNQCFGRAPFFVTQSVYNSIEESSKPFSGNPLYSFLEKKERAIMPSVTVKHLSNTPLYLLKHPGGNYAGENCIVIGDQYYIFGPHLEMTQGITEAAVFNLLRDVFNEARKPYDVDRLSLYAATPEEIHPKFLQTFGQLIDEAEKLRDKTFSEEEFSHVKQNPELELTFDLHKFSIWLQRLENTVQADPRDYMPRPIDYSLMPPELLDVIPFENRTSMDFSKFKQESPQQKELMIMIRQFCQSIMAEESKLTIFTGKAGVGKTASAVCAAKELTARGKKVVWISEVMVHGWADAAKSIADLDNCGLEIDKLLASDPDVVFLDDDNLAGFSGKLLLEKIYSWFVSNPGKGLFITSNEPIRFKDCYGYKLDRKYYYPPFNDYSSPQYLNWQYKTDVAGIGLRSRRDGQSIGAVVSDLSWKINEGYLGAFELIPDFDSGDLASISQALKTTGSMQCSAYNNLRLVQKEWIVEHSGEHWDDRGLQTFHVAVPKKFEKTTCKTIALEIREHNCYSLGKAIGLNSMYQLIRVLNYAHDQGGRRIILINQTSYSTEQLLIQIKAQLPKSESERTWSRLTLLLCETEDSIFGYDQFNGHIEVAFPQRYLSQASSHVSDGLSMLRGQSTPQKLDLRPILSKLQLKFFSAGKLSVQQKGIELPKTEISMQKPSAIPREMSTKQLRKQEEEFLTEHRHDSAELQHEYDKRFGLILK